LNVKHQQTQQNVDNSSLPQVQVTSQEVRKVIFGLENNNHDNQRSPKANTRTTMLPIIFTNNSKHKKSSDKVAPLKPVITNSNIDINSTLSTLLQQNQLFINRLLERDNTPLRNESHFPTNSDGFYVMSDFHNTFKNFSGIESKAQARNWLQSEQSMTRLHHLPEAFKLEIVQTKSSNCLRGQNFSTWSDFEKQFVFAFANSSTSLV